MKLITFLGTGKYSLVTYVYGEKEFNSDFFSRAVAEWNKPSIVLVLLTNTAKSNPNWGKLQERFKSSGIPLQGIDIPEGRNEEELWQIFQILADQLQEDDEIIFDVTYGFRSLPVLALLAINYLRVVRKNIIVKDALYGAFDAKDIVTGKVPVFSLVPFINLLDWVTATDKFIKSGDAKELGYLLRDANKLPYMQKDIPQSELPTRLNTLSGTLDNLSNALRLTRPQEITVHSAMLTEKLMGVEEEVRRYAPPFSVLLDRIGDAYHSFSNDSLGAQLQLANWYIEHEQEVQAITLANEWLISWTCQKLGLGLKERKTRESVARAINSIIRKRQGKEYEEHSLIDCILKIEDSGIITTEWERLSELRNDVAHCGMREKANSAKKITQNIEKSIVVLNRLYHPALENEKQS